jgi:hypothetical protein
VVLSAALREPAIAKLPLVQQLPDPTDGLARHLRAEFLDGTGVLRVSVGAGTPKEQAALANAVAKSYLREIVHRENDARLARLERLKKLHAQKDEQLRDKRRTLRALAESLGSRDATVQSLKRQFALTQLKAVQAELIQVQSQLRRAQIELALAEKENAAPLKRKTNLLKELERVLGDEVQRRIQEVVAARGRTADLELLHDEVSQVDEVTRELGRQVQRLELEIQAPPRVRLLEEASAPR